MMRADKLRDILMCGEQAADVHSTCLWQTLAALYLFPISSSLHPLLTPSRSSSSLINHIWRHGSLQQLI